MDLSITKENAIALLGPTIEQAAERLGVRPRSIEDWEVNAAGYLKKKRVLDAVFAAGVRKRRADMRALGIRIPRDEARLLVEVDLS